MTASTPTPAADVTISHDHGDGTLLDGSRRGDGIWEAVQPFGFRPFRSLGMLGIPGSRDHVAKRYKIEAAAKALHALGFTVTVTIDDTPRDRGTVLADQAKRLDDRADALTERTRRHQALADGAWERAAQIGERFAGGQPILRGHYSEAGARRDQARMHAADRRSTDEGKRAAELASRTSAVGSSAARLATPTVTARRIKTAEAELRDITRKLNGHTRNFLNGSGEVYTQDVTGPAAGLYREQLLARQEQLNGQVAYDRTALEQATAEGRYVGYGPATVHAGDAVKASGTWRRVVRASKVTVSCETGYTWTDKVPYTDIQDVRCEHTAPDETASESAGQDDAVTPASPADAEPFVSSWRAL